MKPLLRHHVHLAGGSSSIPRGLKAFHEGDLPLGEAGGQVDFRFHIRDTVLMRVAPRLKASTTGDAHGVLDVGSLEERPSA